ncbi:MAG: cytochrome c biogenesis protein CcsA [Planctomycetes bacterium]|nr:cytochrome c biogenesis protein CcsA [Planctomycetota bacterium]
MKAIQPLLLVLFAFGAALAGGCSRPSPAYDGTMQRTAPWDPDLVETMASLPVQENGRVKPLGSFAAFLLYAVHGRRDLKFTVGQGEGGRGEGGQGEGAQRVTLEPTEWLLDVWCYPDQAADYPLFRIENTGVLDALGIENAGQTLNFDYVTFREVGNPTTRARLEELADQYLAIDAKERDAVQEHVVQLYRQLRLYENVHLQLAALHTVFKVEGDELRTALGGETIRIGDMVRRSEPFRELVKSANRNLQDPKLGNMMAIFGELDELARHAALGLFPPAAGQETWNSIDAPMMTAFRGDTENGQAAMFLSLQDAIAADSQAAKATGLRQFHDAVVAAAKARGEYGAIDTETEYYRASWHYKALHWFIFGFLLAGVCWLVPKNRLLWWASFGVTSFALCLLCYDIYLRCVITGRPPITRLYDTFLFIAAFSVLTLLVVEWILPRRIALGLAPLAGALLIMLARMFEVSDGKDTLDPLVAVLDSNYWLATHVTMINTGYAAGLAASALALAWVFVRVTRIAHPSDALSKSLVRGVYGVSAFSLVFAVVGTIWGGVWANDSWGRFWGWDPKENGALMICLSQIAMVHARMSGMIRDFGTVMWAAFTGMVVMFSWFHTNLLGVGLHNYGFSSGLRDGVWTGYSVHLGFMTVGAIDVWLRPDPVRAAAAAAPLPAES